MYAIHSIEFNICYTDPFSSSTSVAACRVWLGRARVAPNLARPPSATNSRAVEMILQAQRHNDPSDAYVRSELPDVFGGTLYTVSWKNGKEGGKNFDNFVFNDGKRLHHFFNPVELTRFLNERRPRNAFLGLLREVFTVGGAPAVIAIVVTITICWLAVSPNGKAIPEI